MASHWAACGTGVVPLEQTVGPSWQAGILGAES